MDLLSTIVGGVGIALVGVAGQFLGWWSPKTKVDVRKTESEIRVDNAEIESSRVLDAEKNSRMALEITAMVRTQLDKANLIIDKLSMEKDTMRELILEIKNESRMRDGDHQLRLNELEMKLNVCEKHLEEQKAKCAEVMAENESLKLELEVYINKYGKI